MGPATTLNEAMNDWRWHLPIDQIEIIDTDCLGSVIFRNADKALMILDVVSAEVRPYPRPEVDSLAGLSHLTVTLETQGLILGSGQCYGLKPHAIFKKYTSENLYVASLPEYISFMGAFHRQIKDLPDGAAIRFKVAHEPPNNALTTEN